MADNFNAVGGHAANIFYGNRTSDGRKTLQKPTTAWEVIYYIPMRWGKEVLAYVDTLTSLSEEEQAQTIGFVKAVQGLTPFTPRFFSTRLPAAPWQPSTLAVREALAPMGGADKLRETWLEAENADCQPLWGPLFVELFVGTLSVTGFSDALDQPLWGIGLVDETSGMQEPAAMDVKVGYYRHSPFTPADKVARMHRKEANSVTRKAALRICGMRRFRHDVSPVVEERYGKEAGYVFTTPEELAEGMRAFFSTKGSVLQAGGVEERKDLVIADRTSVQDDVAKKRLRETEQVVTSMIEFYESTPEGRYLIDNFAFVSASLLFMYDATDEDGSAALRLIDLARSGHRRLNFDETMIGFLQGLKNVRSVFAE